MGQWRRVERRTLAVRRVRKVIDSLSCLVELSQPDVSRNKQVWRVSRWLRLLLIRLPKFQWIAFWIMDSGEASNAVHGFFTGYLNTRCPELSKHCI